MAKNANINSTRTFLAVTLSYLLAPQIANINSRRNALICQNTNIYSSEHKLIYSIVFLPYFNREILTLGDGGQVALDWVHNDASPHARDVRPTVIVLPGLTGKTAKINADRVFSQTLGLGV